MPKVLVFSPYTAWEFHANYEITIAHACIARGAQVKYLLCDAQMRECDMYGLESWKRRERPANLCETCQASSSRTLRRAGIPFEWLSQWSTPAEREEALAWAKGLELDELEHAHFRDKPVGEWITTSVVSYFREYPIRLNDPRQAAVWRGFLHGVAVVVVAMQRVLDEWKPDALLVFNGRMGAPRAALNLARERGVTVLVHERPWRPGGIFVLEGVAGNDTRPHADYAQAWAQVPLTREQARSAARYLQDRRFPPDRALDLLFAAEPKGSIGLLEGLGLDPALKTWALFTSSADEHMGDPALLTPFKSQEAWIEAICAWVKPRQHLQLVIRVHPNVGGGGLTGRSSSQMAYFDGLAAKVPPNVRVVGPQDPLSSYDLMAATEAGLTYGSTAGLEMMAMGKPILTVPPVAYYSGAPGVISVTAPELLEECLQRLDQPHDARLLRRSALRWVYRPYFQRQPNFKLVVNENRDISKRHYRGLRAVGLGANATLDRICDYMFHGTPIFPAPVEAEAQRSAAGEDAILNLMEKPWFWREPPQDWRRLGIMALGQWRRCLGVVKDRIRPWKHRVFGTP